MTYDPGHRHRRSIRLSGYDYSQPGAYFVTICTQNRKFLFGDVIGGTMQLNDAGRMVCQWYTELENKFPDIQCDEFVCMPNHVHFVVVNVGVGIDVGVNVGADLRVCPGSMPPPGEHGGMGEQHGGMGEHIGSPIRGVIQWFKTMTTNGYIRGVKQNGWPPFPGKLWQRNYWEHIVRSETEMRRIRQYIRNNPENWDSDTFRVVRCQGNT